MEWEQPLEATTFPQRDFFLEYLVVWGLYFFLIATFLVTNTFPNQLLLEDKYFFSTATLSKKFFFQFK